jgi:phage gp46-like protein
MADLSFLFDQQKRHSDIRIVGGDFLLCDSPQIDVFLITLNYPENITVTGAGSTDMNGVYSYNGDINGRPSWQMAATPFPAIIDYNNGAGWQIRQFTNIYENLSSDQLPPKTGWSRTTAADPAPTLNYSIIGIKETVFNSSSLQVAVELSLFTDRRATLDEIRTFQGGMKGRQSRRGLWANSFKKHTQGSGLWLLQREKKTNSTLSRAKKACTESLQWLIDDGVVRSITVEVEFIGDSIIILVSVVKPDGQDGTFKFQSSWNALEVI